MPHHGTRSIRIALACALCLFGAMCFGCAPSAAPTLSAASPAASAPATPVFAASPTPSPTAEPTPSPTPSPDPAMQSVTFAWLSDTQGYSAAYPEVFTQMTDWIVSEREALNIRYVIHTGDIVNDVLRNSERTNAENAMLTFKDVLPVFAVAGNHDNKGMDHNYTFFGALMDKLGCAELPTFGAMEASWRRRYDLVTVGHDDFILIGAGYCLTKADTDWMNEALSRYPDRTAILVAHWYLDLKSDALTSDSKRLYTEVVAKNPNVRYVLCGHRHGLRRVEQTFDDDGDGTIDRTVYAVLTDYQGTQAGGFGYLTLMTFDPAARVIRMTSYSPYLDDYNYYEDESIETFTLPLDTIPAA